MPFQRLVFASSKSSLQTFRRFAASKRFSSSIYTGSASKNIPPHPLNGTECLNHFKKGGPSKRYFCSNTRSTGRTRSQLHVQEPPVPPISWRSFAIPAFLVAGFGGLAFFIHKNDEKRAVTKGKGENYVRSAIQGPIIGGPFSLIDTEGQLVTEKNLLGNWVLLYFGYTSSPDVGPAEVQKMAKSINILESKENLKVLPIFVTIDPQRDNPSQLRAYLREFDSKIVGLTGPVTAVRQMAQEYRVFFRRIDEAGDDYLIESSHNMYLVNPNMEVERSFGVEYNADELAGAISKEMNKAKVKTLCN